MQMTFEEKLQDDLDCLQTDYDDWCRKAESYEAVHNRWKANMSDENLCREEKEWYMLVREYSDALLRRCNDMEREFGRFLSRAQKKGLADIIEALS